MTMLKLASSFSSAMAMSQKLTRFAESEKQPHSCGWACSTIQCVGARPPSNVRRGDLEHVMPASTSLFLSLLRSGCVPGTEGVRLKQLPVRYNPLISWTPAVAWCRGPCLIGRQQQLGLRVGLGGGFGLVGRAQVLGQLRGRVHVWRWAWRRRFAKPRPSELMHKPEHPLGPGSHCYM
jgi:hypothetical protein